MKNCYTLLLVIFSSLSLGQNWSLFDQNKTYHYKHSDSVFITNTIQIDSVNETALDTNFYFRTRIEICDTCTVIPFQALDGILYRAFAPEIFGFSSLNTVATNEYSIADGVIKYHSQLSDSWSFNSGLGITATLVNTGEMLLFGSLDSIKTIQLSTLDTIIISKNFGIIRYPDFDNAGKYFLLSGFQNSENAYGEYVPDMWQIYAFQVDDVFCYNSSRTHPDNAQISSSQIKIKILEDLSVTDTLIYKIKLYRTTHYEYWGPSPEFADPPYTTSGTSIHLIKIPFHNFLAQNCSGMYPLTPSEIFESQLYPPSNTSLHFYDPNQQCSTEDGQEFAYISSEYNSTYGYLKKIKQYNFYTDSLCYISNDILSNNNILYGEGIGLYSNNYGCFETMDSDLLVGSVLNGIQAGTIYNFPEDLGIDNSTQTDFLLYPNPASDQIQLDANFQELQVYSLNGQLILHIQNPGQTIAVGDLEKGMYMVKAIDVDGNLLTTKLIIE